MQDMYTVMIVDDEKAIRDSLPAVINFEMYGFRVCQTARNGQWHSKKYGGASGCTASRYSYANFRWSGSFKRVVRTDEGVSPFVICCLATAILSMRAPQFATA